MLSEPGYFDTGFTQTTLDLLEQPGSPYAASLALADGADEKLARFAAKPRAVSRAIEKAIVRRWRRARYVAPGINAMGPWMRWLLPTCLLDWVFRRVAGLVPARRPRALPSGA